MRREGDVTIQELQADKKRMLKVIEEHSNHELWVEIKQILHTQGSIIKEFNELSKDLVRSRDSFLTRTKNAESKILNYKVETTRLRKDLRDANRLLSRLNTYRVSEPKKED